MHDAAKPTESREAWRRRRAEAIERFLSTFAPSENGDLLGQMLVTICRLGADGADRGDLKILNTALRELRYAFKVFSPYSEIPKVSIFGSARTPPDHPQYLAAKRFAGLMRSHGWMIITGAGDGIMRAGHDGATSEASFGVAISLPFEQSTNAIIANDPKLVNFKYFFTRKLVFVKEATAIVLFPGGYGTLDEGFESLTLLQTVKTAPKPIVLCDEPGGTYWRHWCAHVQKEVLGNGMIDEADLKLFHLADSPEDAVNEILRFYRRYHSSRFVGDLLVMRLNEPIVPSLLEELNTEFGDILTGGRFEAFAGPLEGEDGRSAGRLRALINRINDAP